MLLRYIPEDPTFVPPPETGEACGSLLAEATGRPASARRIEGVELVAPAGPFVAIRCPACGADLAADWWRQRLEGARETGYVELGVTVPCCGAETSLHDLECRLSFAPVPAGASS